MPRRELIMMHWGMPPRRSNRSYRPAIKPLLTLRDAALYITKLPKAEHDVEEWQAAMERGRSVNES